MTRILAALLFLFLAVEARAAWNSDGSTGVRVTIADNAALDLPDGDWTIAGYFRITANDGGSTFRPILSFSEGNTGGTTANNPALIVWCSEASTGVPNQMRVVINDDDTDDMTRVITSEVCGSAAWQRLIIERSGTTVTVYIDGVSVSSGTDADLDASTFSSGAIVGAGSEIGSTGARAELCDWAKWNRVLSAGERAALDKGFSVKFFSGWQWLLPMIRDYTEIKTGITLTNNSTTVTACPAIIYPS